MKTKQTQSSRIHMPDKQTDRRTPHTFCQVRPTCLSRKRADHFSTLIKQEVFITVQGHKIILHILLCFLQPPCIKTHTHTHKTEKPLSMGNMHLTYKCTNFWGIWVDDCLIIFLLVSNIHMQHLKKEIVSKITDIQLQKL